MHSVLCIVYVERYVQTIHIPFDTPASEVFSRPSTQIFFPVTSAELFFFFSLGKIFGYLAKFGKKIWILLTSLLDRLWWFFLDFFFLDFFFRNRPLPKKKFFFFFGEKFCDVEKKKFFLGGREAWEAGPPGREAWASSEPCLEFY